MKDINWLKSVGKVVLFKLDGTTDDESVAVYKQTIAVKIKAVNVINYFTFLYFEKVEIFGDALLEEKIDYISITNERQTIHMLCGDYDIRGEVLEVY